MNRRASVGIVIALAVLVILVVLIPVLLEPASPAAPGAASPSAGVAKPAVPGASAASGSWYAFYFTDPKYPDNPANHHGGLDEKLVALMDSAQKTMDVADYDFDLKDVAGAMVAAKKRGVRVRMVTDTDTLTNDDAAIQAAFKALKSADIPIVDDQRPAIMHDKYTVVDGEWVATGSWNYTDGDTYHLNNWVGIFHSKDLADNYTFDFEQMFSNRKFGASKKAPPRLSLDIQGEPVQNCFSPEGSCADLLISTVKNRAKATLSFMAFSFTHDGIGNAIVDRAKAGVKVQGVFETTGSQTPFSEYTKMKKAGLDVYTDGNPWVMHHKVIIIDDHLVIAGSFNFSSNADQDNDENLLIFDDPTIARAFKAEFDKVLAQAKNPPPKKQGTTREKP